MYISLNALKTIFYIMQYIDVGNAFPTRIQEFDGFDTTEINSDMWEETEEGSTTIEQAGGELVFANSGAGTKGCSYYESTTTYGKNWRITVDIKAATMTPVAGGMCTGYLCLYKDADNYVKIGPLKTSAIDTKCFMWVKTGAGIAEVAQSLIGDVNDGDFYNYTIAVLHNAVVIFCNDVMLTSFPFKELYNYSVVLAGETASAADVMSLCMNDFEAMNDVDLLTLKIGEYVKAIEGKVGTSITGDISGNITISDTTEQFLTFTQATYGQKFKVNLFADLEGQSIKYCAFSPAGGALEDLTAIANNLVSNSIKLCQLTGAVVNDAIYFEGETEFKRLDIYMEGGTSNTDNVYVWEYWNGSAWATLTVTDGTVYNSKVFGKSGSVTWSTTIKIPTGHTYYAVRARITTAGSSKPKATHVQISEVGEAGFDALATFLSSLTVSIYRKRGDGAYGSLPVEIGLPYTQCILYRSLGISDLPCWGDTKIGIKLSAAPTAEITIPYTGYVETVEE